MFQSRQRLWPLVALGVLQLWAPYTVTATALTHSKHHHHHKKHHGRHHHRSNQTVSSNSTGSATATAVVATAVSKVSDSKAVVKQETESELVSKMKSLEKELAGKTQAAKNEVITGRLHLNAPLPADFNERFQQAVAKATGCQPAAVLVVSTSFVDTAKKVADVQFKGPVDIVHSVEDQAADPRSKLTDGPMRPFLVTGESIEEYNEYVKEKRTEPPLPAGFVAQEADSACDGVDPRPPTCPPVEEDEDVGASAPPAETCPPPCSGQNIDIDTEMPYGDLEPFGREDTAQELTESSITESDEMVDQLEKAEVAEEKRAVFRALTRLRGAAITSFDGIARSQTGNIDEYNKVHKWRTTHPLRHLADEESDVTKWAFPENADF